MHLIQVYTMYKHYRQTLFICRICFYDICVCICIYINFIALEKEMCIHKLYHNCQKNVPSYTHTHTHTNAHTHTCTHKHTQHQTDTVRLTCWSFHSAIQRTRLVTLLPIDLPLPSFCSQRPISQSR